MTKTVRVSKSKLASILASQRETQHDPLPPSSTSSNQTTPSTSTRPSSGYPPTPRSDAFRSNPKNVSPTTTTTTMTTHLKPVSHVSQHQKKLARRLASSQFRLLNETLYTSPSEKAFEMVQADPDLFETYHDGFRQQVQQWPINPVDAYVKLTQSRVLSVLQTFTKNNCDGSSSGSEKPLLWMVDMGCGDAKIATTIYNNDALQNMALPHLNQKTKKNKQQQNQKQLLHGDDLAKFRDLIRIDSFDLVAKPPYIDARNMSDTKLPSSSVDVVVFCLSLMATDLNNVLNEAVRILKTGGEVWVTEVTSRMDENSFSATLEKHGLKVSKREQVGKMFNRFFCIKTSTPDLSKNKKKRARGEDNECILKPCIYKRR